MPTLKSLMRQFVASVLLIPTVTAHAQTDVLVEVELARKSEGALVYQRAILTAPAGPADTALLFFRGVPGYAMIRSVADKQRNLPPFIRSGQRLFAEAGIALVIVDCPTDQWGAPGGVATNCLDDYRASATHAADVRSIIRKIRDEHGLTKIFIMGHSMGTLSSRWLGVHLGLEISGSIHSAAVNVPNRFNHYHSAQRIPYAAMRAPVLHVHHEEDACRGTPYSAVKRYAGPHLVTVRGGSHEGDPCGVAHLHSYQGREHVTVTAIVDWIKSGRVTPVVGE